MILFNSVSILAGRHREVTVDAYVEQSLGVAYIDREVPGSENLHGYDICTKKGGREEWR